MMLHFTGELCELCHDKLYQTEFLGQTFCNNPECSKSCIGYVFQEGSKTEAIPKFFETSIFEKPRKQTFEEMRQEMLIAEKNKTKRRKK